jgi:hypothetical protein
MHGLRVVNTVFTVLSVIKITILFCHLCFMWLVQDSCYLFRRFPKVFVFRNIVSSSVHFHFSCTFIPVCSLTFNKFGNCSFNSPKISCFHLRSNFKCVALNSVHEINSYTNNLCLYEDYCHLGCDAVWLCRYQCFRGTCCLFLQNSCTEHGGSKLFRNFGTYLPKYMRLHPSSQ